MTLRIDFERIVAFAAINASLMQKLKTTRLNEVVCIRRIALLKSSAIVHSRRQNDRHNVCYRIDRGRHQLCRAGRVNRDLNAVQELSNHVAVFIVYDVQLLLVEARVALIIQKQIVQKVDVIVTKLDLGLRDLPRLVSQFDRGDGVVGGVLGTGDGQICKRS